MPETDLVITKIVTVREDTLRREKPYVPFAPREFNSIAYITDGALDYTLGGRTVRAQTGELLAIAAGSFDVSAPARDSVSYIYSDFHTLSPLVLAGDFLEQVNRPADPVRYFLIFTELFGAWRRRQPGYALRCRELLYAAVGGLVEEKYKNDERNVKYGRISPAVCAVDSDYGDPSLSVVRLADLCGMTPGNLYLLFRELFGLSPSEYILKVRMENARLLLRNKNTTVSEAAALSGYSDIYSFSRAFKRVNGFPPSRGRGDA